MNRKRGYHAFSCTLFLPFLRFLNHFNEESFVPVFKGQEKWWLCSLLKHCTSLNRESTSNWHDLLSNMQKIKAFFIATIQLSMYILKYPLRSPHAQCKEKENRLHTKIWHQPLNYPLKYWNIQKLQNYPVILK